MKSSVIKAGKAEIKVLADLVSGEGSHPGLQEASFVPWVPELFPGCLCECSESILGSLPLLAAAPAWSDSGSTL